MDTPRFVIACPFRTNYYVNYAQALEQENLLRLCALWTRRPMSDELKDKSRLFPALGLLAYLGAKTLPPYYAEAFRFSLYPLYDQWAKSLLQEGDHVLSSYAYGNACFAWAKKHGGKTFLDGGNSHPDNFWSILEEEHRRWNCPYPPVPRFYYERARRMMEHVDYVLSPSTFVSRSFLERGFRSDQVLPAAYAVDISNFRPSPEPRPPERPFTLINTSGLSLRKGTPYLLEAFRLIRRQIPNARLIMTKLVTDSMKPLMARYADLPIEWVPPVPHNQLAKLLHSADVFVLSSLEEGSARTALEAIASGIPAILTPNTGSNDFLREAVTGSVVPIRDSQAIAVAACWWWEKIQTGYRLPPEDFGGKMNPEHLKKTFRLIAELAPPRVAPIS